MKRLFFAILLAVSFVAAQERADPREAVVIPIKTLSGDSFERLVKLLNVFQARFSADERLRTIVVYAPKETIAEMRRVIEQLDKPGSEAAIGRNIEMTLSFLRCSLTAQPDAKPLPAELEPVAKQLLAATQYKTVQLWDILPLRIQEGRQTGQTYRLPGTLPGSPHFPTANVSIYPVAVTRKDDGRYVRFETMRIFFRVPNVSGVAKGADGQEEKQFQWMEVGLNTAGDFKEGQKTVLGKVSGLDDESAIFVVVALKVLD